MNSKLIFQDSYWLLLSCLAVGLGYAWVLYSRKTILSQNLSRILALARVILVALICFLILNPLLKTSSTKSLRLVLVVGLDNSASMRQLGTSQLNLLKTRIQKLLNNLEDSDFDTEIRLLSGEEVEDVADSLEFKTKKTDFGFFFRSISDEFEGQNLRKVVIISDGMVNAGLSHLQRQFPFEIDVVGFGDSTVKRDLSIKGLTANKLAYLGNSFPLHVDVSAKLFGGSTTTILIRSDGEVVDRKVVNFLSDDDFKTTSFQLNAKEIGKQNYTIDLLPLAGENNILNNSRDIVVDVVDGKEKILLVGLTPHPDLKALKAIIEKNPLFELKTKIVQIDEMADIERTDFDLLILHQMPDVKGISNDLTTKLLAKLKPTLFVLGSQSDISRFNGMQEVVGISGQAGKTDKVTGTFNSTFVRFGSREEFNNIIARLPPLIAPFGEYRAFPGSNIILYQKVGTVLTDRPLLAVNTNAARKAAVLLAEGLWQWRIEEFFMNESHEAVDDYLLKTLQLISVKEDKNKLRVYPIQNEIDIDESVIFQTEAYNDLYERVFDVAVSLTLKGPGAYERTFNYTVNNQNSSFEISNLTEGVYSYKAEATILNSRHTSAGQFVVKDQDLEFLNTTANFDLLRTLAAKNGGQFYHAKEIDQLSENLLRQKLPSRLVNTEDLKEIINLWWLLPLLILLASLEWGTRKYLGTY